MSACDNTKTLFSDYLDHLLNPAQRNEVAGHLSKCPDCKRTFAQIKLILRRFQTVDKVTPSENFDKKLRARIMGNHPQAERSGYIKNFGFGFSGVVVLAALTFFVFSTVNTPNTDLPHNSMSGSAGQTEQIVKPQEPDLKLASEEQATDSLHNANVRPDQKIQLVGQENEQP